MWRGAGASRHIALTCFALRQHIDSRASRKGETPRTAGAQRTRDGRVLSAHSALIGRG
jgi:hypothetical protein